MGADVVDEEDEERLVVVERVDCTELVEVVLGTLEDEDVVLWVVVVVEVVDGTELEVELVVDVVDCAVVVVEVVVGTALVVVSLLELELVVVTGTEVVVGSADVVGSGEAVELLSRLASLTRLAIVSSSPCRASAALMSVGKTPSWNLRERACRAS